jgi:hypothetical protein
MSRHPDTFGGNLAQQRIEQRTVGSVVDWIDPHQDAIESQELFANFIDGIIAVGDRLDHHRQSGECLIQRAKAPVCARQRRHGSPVTSRQHPDSRHAASGS